MKRWGAFALALALASPALAQAPQVTCKDGSTSKGGQGACSHHGGVAAVPQEQPKQRLPPPVTTPPVQGRAPTVPARPEKGPPAAGQPTARCKDGSMSYAKHHSGACSHHGGVAQWM